MTWLVLVSDVRRTAIGGRQTVGEEPSPVGCHDIMSPASGSASSKCHLPSTCGPHPVWGRCQVGRAGPGTLTTQLPDPRQAPGRPRASNEAETTTETPGT